MLRGQVPVRSVAEVVAHYRTYKGRLRTDFGESCGYCDAPDYVFGGIRSYQIDHFAPKKKFPDLEHEYGNLVYACAFCNRAKWDKWVGNASDTPNDGDRGFVDPCSNEYEQHLGRSNEGQFEGLSNVGGYMLVELKLGLRRHQIVWQSQAIKRLRARLRTLMGDPRLEMERRLNLCMAIDELTQAYESFKLQAIEH